MVPACHNVGKTWMGAALTSWHFDTFTDNAVVITTAPNRRQVEDLLWTDRGRMAIPVV
jgi:hypothetical protein